MSENPASHLIIAIDGPAGAGKSTVAARLAERYGLVNLETGAMYRAFALKAIERDADFDSAEELRQLALGTTIRLTPAREGNTVWLDGVDVTRRLRDPDVTAAASRVSVHPAIREWMVSMQRELGARGGVVMEGRDIGTAVFPNAGVKIFLDAAAEVRGQRRFRQNGTATAQPPESVLAEMRERDRRDRTRAQSPLVPAADAIVIDSTHLTLEEVLSRVESIVDEKLQVHRQ